VWERAKSTFQDRANRRETLYTVVLNVYLLCCIHFHFNIVIFSGHVVLLNPEHFVGLIWTEIWNVNSLAYLQYEVMLWLHFSIECRGVKSGCFLEVYTFLSKACSLVRRDNKGRLSVA